MLYDPKWEVEIKPAVYSLAGFTAWLETQSPKTRYDWYSIHECVVCQYLRANGVKFFIQDDYVDLEKVFSSIEEYQHVAGENPWTFGAALTRAREALASRA